MCTTLYFYFCRTNSMLITKNVFPVCHSSVQFSSVAQLCPTLCNPMNRSTPGLPAHHQLLEFTQAHIHRVGDAIQPSHPLSSPSPPAPNPSQHQSIHYTVDPLDPFHLPLHLFPFGNRYSVLCISMCVFMWFGLFTYFVSFSFFFFWLFFKLHIWVKWDSILCADFSQHRGFFQWVGSSHQVAKVLELEL